MITSLTGSGSNRPLRSRYSLRFINVLPARVPPATRNPALTSSRLSATPLFGPCDGARHRRACARKAFAGVAGDPAPIMTRMFGGDGAEPPA